MNRERWRALPGYVGLYAVSDQGRVRSLDRVATPCSRSWRGRVLRPVTMKNGYQIVNLWRDGSQVTRLIHRLVLMAFIGECPEGYEALHADGDRANNALTNLSWGTHSENQYDQVAHGTHKHAAKTSCVKGHPFTPENTYFYPNKTHRACRTCRRQWGRENARRRQLAQLDRESA